MPASKQKNIRVDRLQMRAVSLIGHVRNFKRAARTISLSTFLGLLLVCSFGCAPSSSSTGDGEENNSASPSNDLPEITDEKIRDEINDVYVREIPEESGAGEPINWGIDEDEPKEFTVLEKQMKGDRATILIDIKTQSSARSRSPKFLSGTIRTKWKLHTGWALRTWEIVDTENVSMKYKNLPKPVDTNNKR